MTYNAQDTEAVWGEIRAVTVALNCMLNTVAVVMVTVLRHLNTVAKVQNPWHTMYMYFFTTQQKRFFTTLNSTIVFNRAKISNDLNSYMLFR
jgi:hypothetical protein